MAAATDWIGNLGTTPTGKNLIVFRGVVDTIGFAFDASLSLADAELRVRDKPGGTTVLQIRMSTHAGAWSTGTPSAATVTLPRALTQNVAPGLYVYAITVEDTSGNLYTVQHGVFYLEG